MRQVVSPIAICGTGFYVPDQVVTNEDYEKAYGIDRDRIKAACGVETRRKAAPGQYGSDMGTAAAQRALAAAKVSPEEIDLIIFVSTAADYMSPPTACVIQDRLGAKKAAAFDMNAACMGYIWSIQVASQFLANGVYRTALVIASEVTSTGSNYSNADTFILLGDGAGAAVLRRSEAPGKGIVASHFACDGSKWDFATVLGGGLRTFGKPLDKSHYFSMKGLDIYKFAVHAMPETVRLVMAKADIREEEIGLVIPHQANLRILESANKRLGFKENKMFTNVHKYGNTSAASIAIALAEANEQKRLKENDILVLVGFGAGLAWGALAIQL